LIGALGVLVPGLAMGQSGASAAPAASASTSARPSGVQEAIRAEPASNAPADSDADARKLLEQGRTSLRAGDPFAALTAFARARRLRPRDPDIERALADVLVELGAPSAAADVLGDRSDLGVRSRVAAQRLRWAIEIPPRSPDPRRRFDNIDPALTRLEALLDEARAATPVDTGLVTRLQRDRAVALRHRERWQDVVDQVQALRAAGDVVPIYVLQAEADSLLALRRPVDARRVYEEALARLSPQELGSEDGPWKNLMKGRAYAQAESEDFDAAFASADALVASAGGPWRRASPAQTLEANDDWLDARAFAAALRSHADMPADAWARIAPLKDGAPALSWLRAQSADIEAQQGWPRMAEDDIDIAAALAPEDFALRIAQVDSDIRRHRLSRAGERLAVLQEEGGDLPAVQRLGREFDAETGPSVRIDVGGRHVTNQAIRGPGDGRDQSLRFESPPIDGTWRAVALADNSTDTLPEGPAYRWRLGGGVQALWPDWRLEALGWSQSGTLDTAGESLFAQWEPTDHWTLRADVAKHTPEAPLRADFYGITADSGRGDLRYAWSASAEAGLQVQNMNFSDGNRRWQWTLSGTGTVLDRPHLDVTLNPLVVWQRNSLPARPYFSPRESVLADLEAKIEHVLWRSYERILVQRLRPSLGVFSESGFGRHPVGGVGYEQSWRHDPGTEAAWGVNWASNVYDAQREKSLRVYLTFIHKFGP
jgi:poly-beta-1,6 N-acetyl-D-glucosamine export porin PgaA